MNSRGMFLLVLCALGGHNLVPSLKEVHDQKSLRREMQPMNCSQRQRAIVPPVPN